MDSGKAVAGRSKTNPVYQISPARAVAACETVPLAQRRISPIIYCQPKQAGAKDAAGRWSKTAICRWGHWKKALSAGCIPGQVPARGSAAAGRVKLRFHPNNVLAREFVAYTAGNWSES